MSVNKDFDFLEDDVPASTTKDDVVETSEDKEATIETSEDTEDKEATAEANQYPDTNDNVTLAKSPFAPRSDKNTRIKYQLSLSAVNFTPKEALEVTKGVPYYRSAESIYDRRWRETLLLADNDSILTDHNLEALTRENSDWQQKAEYQGRAIAGARPRTEAKGTGNRISGLAAMNKMQEVLGLGAMIKIPLWHSGFHISIKAPSDIQLLNFYEKIEKEKITIGKNTGGLIFANRSTFINKALFELVEEVIYETNIKDFDTIENLAEHISILDLPIIAWGLAYTIFPNGYPYAKACLIDPEKCQHVTEVMLDVAKIMWVDRSRITEKMLKHMSDVPRKLKTIEDIKQYQEDIAPTDKSTFTPSSGGFTIVFKTASLAEHFAAGDDWINELETTVRTVFADENSDANINNYMRERANLTSLRNYRHFVKHVVWEDEETITDEESSIDRLLNTLSAAPEIVDEFVKAADEFIDVNPIALIAVPRVPCEGCEEMPTEQIEKHPWLLPVDPIKLFFALRDRKLQQSILR